MYTEKRFYRKVETINILFSITNTKILGLGPLRKPPPGTAC